MTPQQEQALKQAREVVITTFDEAGRAGSVPIWFAYDGGKVYMATGQNSRKVRKLRTVPRVRLTFPSHERATFEGSGRICFEEAVVRRVAPLLNRKYAGAWGPDADMIRRLLDGHIMLLEIMPLAAA